MEALGGNEFQISVLVLMIFLWIVPTLAALFVIFVLDFGVKSERRARLKTALLPPTERLSDAAKTKAPSKEIEAENSE